MGEKIIRMKDRTKISDLGSTNGGIFAIDSADARIRLGVASYEADILGGSGLLSNEACYI